MEQVLLNIENGWDGMVEGELIETPGEHITEMEVERAIGQMKSGKAGGLTKFVGEMIRAAGHAWVKKMTKICDG